MRKQIISMLLAILLVLSMVPVTAGAAEVQATEEIQQETVETPTETVLIVEPIEETVSSQVLLSETVRAQAENVIINSGTCGDNLTWELDDSGCLTISGSGAMDNFNYSSIPWRDSIDSIISVIFPDGITSIGKYAFYRCSGLTSVEIPDSVITIGDSAFDSCTGLKYLAIGSGVSSFWMYTFDGCESLEGVYIKDLAAWCNINFPPYSSTPLAYAKNLYLNGELLTECVIPEGVTNINKYAFEYCKSLTSIAIPSSVTSIGEDAFLYCSNLTGIWVDPDNTSYSSDTQGVLYDAQKTTLVCAPGGIQQCVIPDGVQKISFAAFASCKNLTSVTIPDSVSSIEKYAFEECENLENVYIEDLTAWCKLSFPHYTSNPVSYSKKLHLNGELLTDCVIPEEITSIGKYAFAYCESLNSITIPDSVTSIGDYAFICCKSLNNVIIPDSVTDIGQQAFASCESLSGITIPGSVASIGNAAFSNCVRLSSIRFQGDAPAGVDVFWGVTAVAQYDEDNATWTSDVMQNYGGNIGWLPFGGTVSGTCGENVTWTLDAEGVLTISGSGDMYDYNTYSQPWFT